MLRYLILVLALTAVLAVPAARSEPRGRTDLPSRAQRVLAEVERLDRQTEQLAEAYDGAGVELAQRRGRLRANARELRVARRSLARARAALARLVVARYENDARDSTVAILLGARRVGDLIDRADAARLIARQDERVLVDVRASRARALAERRQLEQEQRAERDLLATLRRRRAEIAGRLAERQRLLGSIRAEIALTRERERLQQLQLRRQAEARLAAQRISRAGAPAVVGAPADDQPPVATGGDATTAPEPPAPPPTRHAHVVPILLRYLGVPYRWGGASPATGFDCSGLVLYVYAQVGVSLPHNAAMQYGYGSPVDRSQLQPGDIVFFNGLGHDGVYIGGGQFVDAPRTGDVVKIESLSDPYWSAAYVGARRLP